MDWWRLAGWFIVAILALMMISAPVGIGKERKPRTEGEAALNILSAGLFIWWIVVALGRG